MPLVGAAICPHPPLLIPEVGGAQRGKIKNTVSAMEKLAADVSELEVETIVVMSPHNLIYPESYNVNAMSKSKGDFSQFSAPGVSFSFSNDIDLAQMIIKKADSEGVPVVPYDNEAPAFELDHGTLVPLYYLVQELGNVNVLPLAYSFRSQADHFAYGQLLAEVIESYPKKVFFVASGDLSHRLLENTDVGSIGKEFDAKTVNSVKNNDSRSFLEIDKQLRESAGECGYNSIATLFGLLDGLNVKSEVLSYEGPFGVGFLVAEFRI